MLAPFVLVLNGACLLGRSRSGVLVGGSTQAGGVSTSPSLSSVMKSQLAGSWWALVNPFSWQPAHRAFPHISPAPSLPPPTRMLGSRCQPGHSGCSTLYLTVSGSLLSSVPHLPDLASGPSSSQPLECLPTGRPLDPSFPSFGVPHCDIHVTALWLVLWGSLHPGTLWIFPGVEGHDRQGQ